MLEELKKINQALTTAFPPSAPAPKGTWNEFRTFLAQYKVLGTAVAFIIGLYLGMVVEQLAAGIILPGVGVIFPGLGDLPTLTRTYNGQTFTIGAFIASILTFIIIAFVVFLIVKIATKWGMNK
jgi:large conductance mechanosensitive channel